MLPHQSFPQGHPPFLIFAVLLVTNGNSQRIQNDLARAIKGDPFFLRFSLALPGSHTKL